MNPLTTAESMAIAVLRGDLVAARALADLLSEEYSEGAKELLVTSRVIANAGRLRAIFYVMSNAECDSAAAEHLWGSFQKWVSGEKEVMTLHGIDRIEVYELPEPKGPSA